MSSQEEFITKLTKIAVLQISEDIGNEGGVRESSLNTLSEVIQRFIQEIGSMAASFATANGRTQCNYFDIESSLNEIGFDIQELVKFENNSYPLPSPIDIQNLEISNNHNHKNKNNNKPSSKDNDNDNYDGIKIHELQQSIANNEATRNGTIIIDKKSNILELLECNGTNKKKLKRGTKNDNKSKGRRRMKHIPPFCPDYPDNLLYKHTPIFYKPLAHHYDHDGDNKIDESKSQQLEQRKQDNFEKTRKCVINHSELFSGYKSIMNGNDDQSKGKGTKRKFDGGSASLLPKIGKNKDGPPNKRQKLNNQGVKRVKRSDKMENDDDEDEIIENDIARKYGQT